jgi:uncharacterized caspase-like protein
MDWASHQISKTQDDARTIPLPLRPSMHEQFLATAVKQPQRLLE